MRRSASIAFMLVVAACSGSRPEAVPHAQPEEPAVTTPTVTPEPPPAGEPRVTLECVSGPVPAPPGEQPVISRRVEVEPSGDVQVVVTRLGGGREIVPVPVVPPLLAQVRGQARTAIEGAPYADEVPVPDGTVCNLEIDHGGERTTARLVDPTGHASLARLLRVLRSLIERAERPAPPPPPTLAATFERPTAPFATTTTGASLAFSVQNRGTAPAEIDLDALGSAIFALEVHDANGQRMYTVPPGVPPQNYVARTATLAPGASRRIEVLLNVFSPPLPPGTYTARLRNPRIEAEPIQFRVGGR
jgi:hypothetical protein